MSTTSSLEHDPGRAHAGAAAAARARWSPRAFVAGLSWRARVGTVLVLAGAGTTAWYALHWAEETTDDAQVTADIVAVAAQTRGLVSDLLFADNQHVAAGAVLARIDPTEQRARLAQAEAELLSATLAAKAAQSEVAIVDADARARRRAASASLDAAGAAADSSEQDVRRAGAEVDSMGAVFHQASIDRDRVDVLFGQGAVARQALDSAQTQWDAARSSLLAAQARRASLAAARTAALSHIVEARARLDEAGTVDEQVAKVLAQQGLAEARVKAAEAARDAAALDLSYTTVTAKRAGYASNRTISAGQLVQSGQPIVNLVTDETWVVGNFKETQVGRMHPGQQAKVSVDAYGGMVVPGEIESVAGGTGASFALLPPENATGNYTKVVQRIPVRVRLLQAPKDKVLRAGMSVVVTVDVRR
jgi:membrane fusion protein (multidrug efflux system)